MPEGIVDAQDSEIETMNNVREHEYGGAVEEAWPPASHCAPPRQPSFASHPLNEVTTARPSSGGR